MKTAVIIGHPLNSLAEYLSNKDEYGKVLTTKDVSILNIKVDEIYNLDKFTNLSDWFSHLGDAKFLQCGTFEMFGEETPNDDCIFHPKTIDGIRDVSNFWFCKNYRNAFGIKIYNAIMGPGSDNRALWCTMQYPEPQDFVLPSDKARKLLSWFPKAPSPFE